jgi:hypothetical protein
VQQKNLPDAMAGVLDTYRDAPRETILRHLGPSKLGNRRP